MNVPINISISAEAVAWYAAIVSTLALIITFLKYWSERINVVVKCKSNWRVIGGGSIYAPNKDYVVVTVINKGKRPVTIQNVGFVSKNKKDEKGILSDSLLGPRELKEGKSTDYLIEQDLVDLKKIKYFVAYDLTGRAYKGKLK
ncbi:MAG: hypothetical protein COS40_05060 [Deltaproteobacteria bacterium CG03_land_8_20_14_0_80_45_14]|jgi:hypothetical protein|nr:MAG: hypothetical protein COS40_05060 [Deltaproteobacteria bacterium CG03_land_8_20_14_0_80_45_14]